MILKKSDGILRITRISPNNLSHVFDERKCLLKRNWNVGRSKRSKHLIFDVLFMLLVVFKVDGSSVHLEFLFENNISTFHRMKDKYIGLFHPWNYRIFCKRSRTRVACEQISKRRVIVQILWRNRSAGNIFQNKRYFSGKHHLYRLKVEISVLLVELAIETSKCYRVCRLIFLYIKLEKIGIDFKLKRKFLIFASFHVIDN